MLKSDMMNGVDVKRFVRFFYDPPPRYDDMSGASIWCLGQEYKSIPPKAVSTTDHDDLVEVESSTDSRDLSEATGSTTEDAIQSSKTTDGFDTSDVSVEDTPSLSNDPADGGWPLSFLDDFESKAWMTYRSQFPPIPRSTDPNASSAMTFAVRLRNLAEKDGFSSDTGWGCMIRSGQSLLANALIFLHLGRGWRLRDKDHPQPGKMSQAKILSLFADSPDAPFSIHRFVHHGAASCGKHPGQWFGPSATASCIAALSNECAAAGLKVYVTPSTSDVYEDKFRALAAASLTNPTITPTLILLGTRLGPDRITPVYYEALKQSLSYPQSIGIAGGRPSSSHYFIGCQNDVFFYLDPHETRPAFPYHDTPSTYTEAELSTCHTRRLRGLRISEMDPSMLIGFLIKDESDWQDFKNRLNEVRGKKIVNIYDREPPIPGEIKERREAVDEVETWDDDDDEDEDGVTVTGD